jgi:uncharacterized membrane protein
MIKRFSHILILFILSIQIVSAVSAPADVSEKNSEPVFTTYPTYVHQGNKQWIISDANPAKKYFDEITVENLTDHQIALKIEFRESEGTEENFKIIESADYQNIGNWIKLEKSEIILQPYEKQPLKIEINIPENTEAKKYQGTILVSNTQKATNSDLNIATRIGNRVYLNVTNNSDIQTSFSNFEISPEQIVLILISLFGIAFALKPQKQTNEK